MRTLLCNLRRWSCTSVSCVKLFSLKNLYTFTKRGAESELFLFSATHSKLCCQQKLNKATLPNNKTFSTVKLALCVQSPCLLLHNNFLVFNIRDNCWESSHNLWTLPNHNSRVGCGFRFPSMLQSVCSIFYRPVWKTKRSGWTTGKCSPWDDG